MFQKIFHFLWTWMRRLAYWHVLKQSIIHFAFVCSTFFCEEIKDLEHTRKSKTQILWAGTKVAFVIYVHPQNTQKWQNIYFYKGFPLSNSLKYSIQPDWGSFADKYNSTNDNHLFLTLTPVQLDLTAFCLLCLCIVCIFFSSRHIPNNTGFLCLET